METINHECYVSLEIANLLKEAGFDWKQYSFYNSKDILINGTFAANWNDKIWYIDGGKVSAPTLDIAQRWLREVKNIDINILAESISGDKKYVVLGIWFSISDVNASPVVLDTVRYKSYEEAQEVGIKKALEIILDKEE